MGRANNWECLPCCLIPGYSIGICPSNPSRQSSIGNGYGNGGDGYGNGGDEYGNGGDGGNGHDNGHGQGTSSSLSSISAINETLNLSYGDQIERITDKIKEGSEVMKQMARNLTSVDIAGLSRNEKKNMVRDLAGQLSDFKSKFSSAKNKFDQMYNETKRKNIDEQHYLSVTQNRLTDLNQEKNETRVGILSLIRRKQDVNSNLRNAKAEFEIADRNFEQAGENYRNSVKTKNDWEIACAATFFLVFTCIGYAATYEQANVEYERYKERHRQAKNKLAQAEDLEEKMRLLRTSLERTEKLQDFYQQTSTTLRLRILKQKLILREFSRLQQKIQEFKTEVDVVYERAQSVEGFKGTYGKN